jgi:hypothetical protein
MKKVFKYDVSLEDTFTVKMPIGAEMLYTQAQNDIPRLWALVDTDKKEQEYKFRLAGTGHPIDDSLVLKYIGTLQIYGVFHLFQILN